MRTKYEPDAEDPICAQPPQNVKRSGAGKCLMAIGRRRSRRPVQDDRSPEEIVGYDDDGCRAEALRVPSVRPPWVAAC